MILGHGDIASALTKLQIAHADEYIFFASGVSNSSETRESEYEREKKLLLSQPADKHLVYFGTLALFYNPHTRYAKHKKEMEELVKKNFPLYTIVRIGNITWGKNPHTLINYFKNAKQRHEEIEVWDTYRYIIDEKEFLHWIEMIPQWSCEINIPGKRMKVKEIIKKYVTSK